MLSAADLQYIVDDLLEEGVPAGVLARVFRLPPEDVEEEKRKLRVRRYGTADMDEYLEQAQWDAIDQARKILANGTPTEQTRAAMSLLAKSIGASGKRTPDSVQRARAAVMTSFEQMRGGQRREPPPPGEFVITPEDESGDG